MGGSCSDGVHTAPALGSITLSLSSRSWTYGQPQTLDQMIRMNIRKLWNKKFHAHYWLFFLLCGCFPAHENYWEPHAAGGATTKRHCHQTVGPSNLIVWEREGIRATVFIREKQVKGPTLELTLQIPPDMLVTVHSDHLILRNLNQATDLSVDPFEVLYSDAPEHQLKPVEDRSVLTGKKSRWHFFRFALPQDLDNNFSVDLPTMDVKHGAMLWPQINFVRASGWYIYPLNC